MTTPDEELEQPYIYIVMWSDNECEDACFCSGYIESGNGHIAEFFTLAGARIAMTDALEKSEYGNCTFTIARRERSPWTLLERRTSELPGRGCHG